MENPELSLHEAWKALDKDANVIIGHLSRIPDPDVRVIEAEKILGRAKILAKKLQAKYHPDKNNNSEASGIRFILIGKAIQSLEIHTMNMKAKREEYKLSSPKKERIIL